MKKYTKLMGILLALVMLIALVPMTAMADTPTYPPNTDAPGTMTLVIIKRVYGLDETKEYKFNFKYYQQILSDKRPGRSRTRREWGEWRILHHR